MLAGAGTGKTKALTARIVHLLNTGSARPNEILAVTFTNKAALEMKSRVASALGRPVEGMPWLGTFHSVCVKLLRRHAELAHLKNNFTILDTDDQLRLLKQLIKAANVDEKRWPARHLASLIDGWKNRGLVPESVPASHASAFDNLGTELYSQYQQRLREFNAVDFGDLTSARDECKAASSGSRMICAGGILTNSTIINNIDYIASATAANSVDFGDLETGKRGMSVCGDGTYGIFMGGVSQGANDQGSNKIQRSTIATTGNATDFGDLTDNDVKKSNKSINILPACLFIPLETQITPDLNYCYSSAYFRL